jgi:hypothetical protein
LVVMCLQRPLSDSMKALATDHSALSSLVETAKTRPVNLSIHPSLVESAKTRPTSLAMSTSLGESADALPVDRLIVFFNAAAGEITFAEASLVDKDIRLHPIQAASVDERVRAARYNREAGVFNVPGRTTAVFIVD